MNGTSHDAGSVVCRLCTSTHPGQLQIFGKDGEKSQLSQKIRRCLDIQVHMEDSLSKFVCKSCVAKVEDFHLFQQAAVQAQCILEREKCTHQKDSETTEAAMAEAEKIVERLQAERTALSITPVCSSGNPKCEDIQDILDSPSALSITPVLRSSESSCDDDSLSGFSYHFSPLVQLKNPCAEDYILMQEETFKLRSSVKQPSKTDVIEYSSKMEERNFVKDKDVVETQSLRRVVLPPMWDVYEKDPDKENVTHRRYVVSKSSFPCSLCGSCVAFHCQQTVQIKKQGSCSEENGQDTIRGLKQEPLDDSFMYVKEQQNQLEQNILQDLKTPQFSSQEGGMLDCPECGKLFPRRSSWKRHLRTHYEGRAFTCSLCGKGFNRKEHLSRHMMSHTGGRPFRCETCFKPFTRKEHLARHLACNAGCGGIAAGFPLGINLEPVVPRPYTCDVCSQTFVQKQHMLRHRKRAHVLLDENPGPFHLLDEDVQLFSCRICRKSFPEEDRLSEHILLQHHDIENTFNYTSDENTKVSPLHGLHEEDGKNGPEQIEVEVQLMEDSSDEENIIHTDDLLPKNVLDGEGVSPFPLAENQNVNANCEDLELDKDDLLEIQMNDIKCKAQEVSRTSQSQSLSCEICLKSFMDKSHFMHHFQQFHPHVELAYAAALSLKNVPNKNDPVEQVQFLSEAPSKDDVEADDESGSSVLPLPMDVAVPSLQGKGGEHPCSICGKMFGRRYHLVRHRRTQHGVESVKAAPIGRPPKRPFYPPQSPSTTVLKPFRCSACSRHFSKHSDFCSHSCSINNNTIAKRSGSNALAEMAAKLSDKLNRVGSKLIS